MIRSLGRGQTQPTHTRADAPLAAARSFAASSFGASSFVARFFSASSFGARSCTARVIAAGPRATIALASLMVAAPLVAPGTASGQSLGVEIRLDMEGDGNFDGVQDADTGWLYVQHNKPAEGPRAAHIPFTIRNTTGATLTNLTATLGGLSTSGAIRLGGGPAAQPASQRIGTLAPGETRYVYWYVEYDGVLNRSTPVTVTVDDGSRSTVYAATLRTMRANRTRSGGIHQATQVGPGAIVGQTLWVEAVYSFGNMAPGAVALLQPTGAQGFPAACYQLVGSEVVSSGAHAIPAGTRGRLWFVASRRQGGTNHVVRMRYSFRILCSDAPARLHPFAAQRSGGTMDFSADLGPGTGGAPLPAAPDPALTFDVRLTADPDTLDFEESELTVQLRVANLSNEFEVRLDSIAHLLPAGLAYGSTTSSSDVSDSNSALAPAPGTSGRLVWIAEDGYAIGPRDTLVLEYAARAKGGAGEYVTVATPYIGATALPSAAAAVVVRDGASVSVTALGESWPREELPGTGYAQEFTVESGFAVAESFDLLADLANEATHLVLDSMTVATGATRLTATDSVRVELDARGSAVVTLWFTLPHGSTRTDTLRLRARSVSRGSEVEALGLASVRRISPEIVLERGAEAEAAPRPGAEVVYTILLGNPGSATAHDVVVIEDVPAEVEFKLGTVEALALPSGVGGVSVAFATDGEDWSYTPTDGGCGAPAGYDACVRAIRWTLHGEFESNTQSGASRLIYIVRIR